MVEGSQWPVNWWWWRNLGIIEISRDVPISIGNYRKRRGNIGNGEIVIIDDDDEWKLNRGICYGGDLRYSFPLLMVTLRIHLLRLIPCSLRYHLFPFLSFDLDRPLTPLISVYNYSFTDLLLIVRSFDRFRSLRFRWWSLSLIFVYIHSLFDSRCSLFALFLRPGDPHSNIHCWSVFRQPVDYSVFIPIRYIVVGRPVIRCCDGIVDDGRNIINIIDDRNDDDEEATYDDPVMIIKVINDVCYCVGSIIVMKLCYWQYIETSIDWYYYW